MYALLYVDYPQVLSVWEWPANHTSPSITAPVGASHDYQHCVRFNPVDVRDIVSNGSKEVIFWNWNEDSIAAFHPPKGISKLKKAVRNLSQTTFIPYTTKAVTATTSGHIIAWDYPVSELIQSTGRDAIKILKLVKSGINLLDTVLDKFIVCGCADGAVRFFDFQFRVVAWFEDIQAGHITSISFADQQTQAQLNQSNSQVSMEEFSVPDFIVGTSDGKILQLDSKTMEHLTADKRRGKLIIQGFDHEIYALDTHPSLPIFVCGSLNGTLQVWDVDERKLLGSRSFKVGEMSIAGHVHEEKNPSNSAGRGGANYTGNNKKELYSTNISAKPVHKDEIANDSCQITCLKFSPKGHLLAIGYSNGFVKLVSSQEASYHADIPLFNLAPPLKDVCNFHRNLKSITNIQFSNDNAWFATSDTEGCVAVYRFWHKDEDVEKPMEWIYIGKYRAHYKPIIALFFENGIKVNNEEKESKEQSLLSTVSGLPSSARSHLSSPFAQLTLTAVANSMNHAPSTIVPRLYSLGEDRVLQEYDLAKSSIRSGLKLLSSCTMDQTATPTAMLIIPGLPNTAAAHSNYVPTYVTPASKTQADNAGNNAKSNIPDMIITANDHYKLKVWEISDNSSSSANGGANSLNLTLSKNVNVRTKGGNNANKSPVKSSSKSTRPDTSDTSSTAPTAATAANANLSPAEEEVLSRDKKLRKTLLAPMYGGAINKMFLLPKRDGSRIINSDFMVYSTFEKIVGLIKLPLDGNPNKAMALIAHPGEISCCACTFDGRYLITAGGSDRSVNLWSIATHALDASIALGGQGIQPYMSLIQGSAQGEFYQELLDYFYYAQLRSQSLSTTDARSIIGSIPIEEAMNMMRALGFYPTEHEIAEMKAELHYEGVQLGLLSSTSSLSSTQVDLQELIKLYVNHRPVFGLGKKDFTEAFLALKDRDDNELTMDTADFIRKLQTLGEPMSLEEIKHCLDALLGEKFIPKDANKAAENDGQLI